MANEIERVDPLMIAVIATAVLLYGVTIRFVLLAGGGRAAACGADSHCCVRLCNWLDFRHVAFSLIEKRYLLPRASEESMVFFRRSPKGDGVVFTRRDSGAAAW